jgi:hypothetical protein
MKNISNFTNLLIGKSGVSAPADGVIISPSTISDGAIALCTADGVVVGGSALASNTELVLVQGQGATKPLIKSAPFTAASIITAKKKDWTAAVQQISYVGYNGSTGNLVLPSAGTNVIIRNTFKSNFYQYSDKLMSSIVGKKITSTDTVESVVNKLAKDCIIDIQKYVNIPYKVEILSSNAGVVNAATAGADFTHLQFTKGSSLVVGVNSSGVEMKGSDELIDALAAGYYLRAGTAVTDPIYKIKSVTNGTGTTPAGSPLKIELEMAFQGDTTSIAVGSTEYITLANVAASNVGIKFTGLPQKKFGPNTFRYEVSKFVTTVNGFDPATNVQSAATVGIEGSGTYEQIAQDEFFLQLFEGMHDGVLLQVPPVTMRSNVSTTGRYSMIVIEFKTDSGTMDLVTHPQARKQIIAAVDILAATTQFDALETDIETACSITL